MGYIDYPFAEELREKHAKSSSEEVPSAEHTAASAANGIS